MCCYSKGVWKKVKTTAREREVKTRTGTKEKGERRRAKKEESSCCRKKALADEKKALAAAKKAEKEARKTTGKSNLVSDSFNRKRQSNDYQPAAKKSLRLTEAAASKGLSSPRIASSDGQNECCVCFEMYRGDDDVNDWLQCACSRWLHEECITDRNCFVLIVCCKVFNAFVVWLSCFCLIAHCKQF